MADIHAFKHFCSYFTYWHCWIFFHITFPPEGIIAHVTKEETFLAT